MTKYQEEVTTTQIYCKAYESLNTIFQHCYDELSKLSSTPLKRFCLDVQANHLKTPIHLY